MSGIGGKVREGFKKKVGLFEGSVITINPTAEEFKEVLGINLAEDSKQAEYLGEDDENNRQLRVDFWVKDVKHPDEKYKISIFLTDKNRLNKDGTKTQYINNLGTTSWAADENDLPDWFVKREYRKSYSGEEELYKFLRTWLGNLDYKDAETVLQLDWKTLMKGNVKDLRAQIGGAYSTNIGLLATVRTSDKDGQEYQGVYSRDFLPPYALKHFRLVNYDDENVLKQIASKPSKDQKPHEKFAIQVKGEYGCKDFFVLKDIKEYDAKENPVASNEPKQEISTTGSDY